MSKREREREVSDRERLRGEKELNPKEKCKTITRIGQLVIIKDAKGRMCCVVGIERG